jgi:hypothetical protein
LSRAIVVDPHAVAHRHPDPTIRALTRLTVDVTEQPWALTGADLARVRGAGLDDAGIVHAILQASLFGHLNRIADAVGVEADYPDTFGAPHVEPATPPYLWPSTTPDPRAPKPIDLTIRPGAIDLLEAWRAYAVDRDGCLTRRDRAVIAYAVAIRLGDASIADAAPETAFESVLVDLSDIVTLAPWRLEPSAFEQVRGAGLATDDAVFDVVATASSCTVFSRIAVALAAFAR